MVWDIILKPIFIYCMAEKNEQKANVSIVTCGHVDAGKSTLTGRLIFELGGINAREMKKLQDEADRLGKSSFAFAFYMDTTAAERERGITIQCQTKEFFTDNYHYTIVDSPGHKDFIKNMITGASQCDVALLLCPADGNFATSVAKGDHKAGEVKGQTREHARLINLLGIKQLIVGINKMDEPTAGFRQERYEEVKNEMKDVLVKVGWPKMFVEKAVAFIPVSGFKGDNLLTQSTNMPWWTGQDVVDPRTKAVTRVTTLLDALNNMVKIPPRNLEKPLRIPISQVLKIKGVGDVLTGRVEQGKVSPGDEVKFIPTDSEALPCTGKVFSVEMHHKSLDFAAAGDNVGMSIKGLDKSNMPKSGDVMVLKKDNSLRKAKSFIAQVQVVDHPGELKKGFTPIVFCRTARSACRITNILWRIGKETSWEKADNPAYIKAGDSAEVEFTPQQPFCVEGFDQCEGLARMTIMDGNTCVMLGKVISFE